MRNKTIIKAVYESIIISMISFIVTLLLWYLFENLKYRIYIYISDNKYIFWISLFFLLLMSMIFISSAIILEIKKERVDGRKEKNMLPILRLYILIFCGWGPTILSSVVASIYIEDFIYDFPGTEIVLDQIDVVIISVAVLYIITWLHVYVLHDGVKLSKDFRRHKPNNRSFSHKSRSISSVWNSGDSESIE